MLAYIMIATLEGKNKVLISAPHVFNHYRRNLDSVVKQGEPLTDYIVKNAASLSDCNCIYLESPVQYDPNFDRYEVNEYKQKVDSIIGKKKVKLFIDVHGLSDRHSYDFAIYFPFRYTKSQKVAYELAQELSQGPLRSALVVVLNMKDDGQETLTEFVAQKKKIPAIQLEIARYIREDETLLEPLIAAISKFILNY